MKPTKSIYDYIDDPRIDAEESKLDIQADSVELAKTSVDKKVFLPATYKYIDLSDTKLSNCELNSVVCFRSTLVRINLVNSQLTGLQLPEGNFKSVVINQSRINLSNFRRSEFENCIFSECDLSEADFAASSFKNVLFDNCMLGQVDFSNCKCQNVIFKNCSLVDIDGVSGIASATISTQNLIEIAPLLASELHITVEV